MPVDPYGGGYYSDPYGDGTYDTVYAGQDISPAQGPSLADIISQAIHEGAQTAQVIGSGYPAGSTVVYAPSYPGASAHPVIQPGPPFLQPQAAPGGGVNLSNTTLMLLVGGVLLFMLGSKRGR